MHTLDDLWEGAYSTPDKVELWRGTMRKWEGVVAVGGGRKVRLFLTRLHKPFIPLFTLSIPDVCATLSLRERVITLINEFRRIKGESLRDIRVKGNCRGDICSMVHGGPRR